MGVLRDFEGRLEGVVEGLLSKAFRSGLHPVELARRILKEMDAAKSVGVRGVWVPNRYVLHLSPEDRERLSGMEQALARELEQVVVEGAQERRVGLVARPEVVFETDGGLRRGRVRVESEMAEDTGPPPAPAAAEASPGEPALVLVGDGGAQKRFPLSAPRTVIGRMAGSGIQISDPGASRRHAEIRREGDDFVVVDLGSTNGTLVNDAAVREHVLEPGDRITIGRTTLEFRRG